mgnify:CR=1 FL=1
MGGFVYALTTANCSSNGDVAGFGFLALAVMIFGNWKPLNIAGASLLFGLFKCIAAAYTSLDINGDGVTEVPRTVTLQGEDADHAVSQRVDWISYDASGTASRVLSTYHDVADGWYLQLPEGWPERVWVGRSASPDEIGITFYTGIGVKNVNDRLRIYFGADYGISIESAPYEGTTVTIRTPRVPEDREGDYDKNH